MGVARVVRAGRHGRRWVMPAAALLVLAGCSTSAESTADGSTETPSASESATSDATSGSGATVDVGSTSLGDVLVDDEGLTLYMFDSDTQGGESTCYDQCATAWPPLLTDGAPEAGDGLDLAMLGTVERTDGSTQVTFDGWPLYYWAQDFSAGDVNGQAVNEVWWVLGVDGQPIRG